MADINDNTTIYMTKEGLDKLKLELKTLIEVDRPAVVNDITEARALGDLSENGMYSAAREKQSFIAGRIDELTDILKRVKIAKKAANGIVALGSKVKLHTDGNEVEYTIVSSQEVDFKTGKISHESPIGQSLIGKKLNDVVDVITPAGKIQYKIVEIN